MSTVGEDPLAVDWAELLLLVEELERLNAGLADENAGVSADRRKRLQRLRSQVESGRSSTKWNLHWKVAQTILGEIAVEVIKRLAGTSNYLYAAIRSRRSSYADRRLYQSTSDHRWLIAA